MEETGGDCSEGAIFNSVSDPPSLENLSLVCIAIRLCGNPDLTKYGTNFRNEVTKKFEKNMFSKLAGISLPDLLKMKIANTIRPLGMQLQQFQFHDLINGDYHPVSLGTIYKEETPYYWTMEGTIDKVRSLKEIINSTKNSSNKDENFNYLYMLACEYCLEDCISDLWLKVVDKERLRSYYKGNMRYANHIIAYWCAVLKNKLSSLIRMLKQQDNQDIYDCNLSICENMVALSAFLGNEISFKYFWYKLTENQKISGIDKWLRLALERTHRATRFDFFSGYGYYYLYNEGHTDIMCFLMSHLSRKKEKEILRTDFEKILLPLFHHWPMQRFFLPAITAIFHFLQEDVYIRILLAITLEIKVRKTELFLRKLCQLSPGRLKRAFVHLLMRNSSIIVHLISVNDDVTIDMILFHASSAEKKQIIFGMIKEPDLRNLLYEDMTAVLRMDTMVSKVLSSELDVFDFKRNVELECAYSLCCNWLCQGNVQATEKFLNWIFQSENEIHEYKEKNINPITIYRSLIHSSDCAPAECFLHWYFDTEKELLQFKNTFVHGTDCSACVRLLSDFFHEGQIGWEKFEKFLSYGYISSEELIELKRYLSVSSKTAKLYIDNHAFEFATLFLHWCLDSSDEINRFKTEVLLSKEVFMCLIRWESNPNWEKVKKVLKWFSPFPKEIIVELKSVLVRDFSYMYNVIENVLKNKLILFDLLDSFSEEHQMPDNMKSDYKPIRI